MKRLIEFYFVMISIKKLILLWWQLEKVDIFQKKIKRMVFSSFHIKIYSKSVKNYFGSSRFVLKIHRLSILLNSYFYTKIQLKQHKCIECIEYTKTLLLEIMWKFVLFWGEDSEFTKSVVEFVAKLMFKYTYICLYFKLEKL